MDTILHNAKCWFTADGRLEVYHHELATKLNKHFKTYDNGNYRFKRGEEAVFKVPSNQTQSILLTYLTKKQALTQGAL